MRINVSVMTLIDAAVSTPEQRVVDGALRCVSRWGVGKTTLDDAAREAGCSRATVYRLFPGGKDGLLDAVCRAELARFFVGLTGRLEAVADQGVEALLVAGMSEAGRRILDHPALQYVLTHEPEAIAPRLAFPQMDLVLRTATAFATPWLTHHLDDEEAGRLAEWVTRILISYAVFCLKKKKITTDESSP